MLEPIVNDAERASLQLLKIGLVDGCAHLNNRWLIAHEWAVVPVESARLSEADAHNLARAFSSIPATRIFAVATDHLFEDESYYEFAPTVDGLLEFAWKTAPFNFVLLPADRRAAVLNTVFDYHLVAGPRSFVAVGVGGEIGRAWTEFRSTADDPIFEGRLQKIAARYEAFSSLFA